MRTLMLDAVIAGTTPEDVFDNVVQFGRYPELAPHVQTAVVHQSAPAPTGRSSWELHFRSGLLRWTEEERFRRDDLRLEFEQVSGDFEEFCGHWSFARSGSDTKVHFRADFDFGIPSMEGILDPIAERVIKETVAWVLMGMFTQVRLNEQFALHPLRTT